MGVGEQIKGQIKEVAGEVTNNDGLRLEGASQAEKGREESKADVARAEADAHDAKASGHELGEKLGQAAK